MKKYCSDCGRQICSQIFDTAIQAPLPVIKGVAGSVICADCSIDYDANGLLPTERDVNKNMAITDTVRLNFLLEYLSLEKIGVIIRSELLEDALTWTCGSETPNTSDSCAKDLRPIIDKAIRGEYHGKE